MISGEYHGWTRVSAYGCPDVRLDRWDWGRCRFVTTAQFSCVLIPNGHSLQSISLEPAQVCRCESLAQWPWLPNPSAQEEMTVNSATNVIELSPYRRGSMHPSVASVHHMKGRRQTDLAENLPEASEQEHILRELLDDSHRRIRELEAQLERMRSALIETGVPAPEGLAEHAGYSGKCIFSSKATNRSLERKTSYSGALLIHTTSDHFSR